jgi:hypothetical protein
MGGAGAGDLEVDGWSTTTAAELIDLDRLAELTREAAGRLTEIGCRMSPLAASPDLLASAPLSPVTAAEAEAAIVGATTGPAGALVVAAGLEATGLLVEAAAQTYRRAEQAADGLVSGCQFLAGLAVGLVLTSATEDAALVGGAALLGTAPMWGPALVSSVWALPYAVRAAQGAAALDWSAPMTVLQAFATGHPELVQQFTAGGGGLLSGAELALAPILRERVIGAVGLPISTRDAALVLASQYVDGTPVVTSLPDPTSPPDASAPTPSAPTGIGDLFADLARDVADSGLPGRITITTLHTRRAGATGETRYIVALPGMDSLGLPGHQSADARDNSGNVRLVGGLPTAYTRGVARALSRAGVPHGATIALIGHSQGGLAAVELAGDPSFRRDYTVTHVLTAASPISRMPKNPDVAYLSLENEHDIVPRLDGASSVALPNFTVARFCVNTGSIVGNHDMSLYARSARLLDADAAADADLRKYLDSLHAAGFLVGHGDEASVERHAFRITSDRRHGSRPRASG